MSYDRPVNVDKDLEYEMIPRDAFGVPAHIPPDLSTNILHTYAVPPEYYPALKRFGDENPSHKVWFDKLIHGELSYLEYEEMFYRASKPLKTNRKRIPLGFRTAEEETRHEEVNWDGVMRSFQQRAWGEYLTYYVATDLLFSIIFGLWVSQLWVSQVIYYREDMKLFYVEAPEHKIWWLNPRGDL